MSDVFGYLNPGVRTSATPSPLHPDQVWDAARADYLAGEGVPRCANTMGCALALLPRARTHGWKKPTAAATDAAAIGAAAYDAEAEAAFVWETM